MTIEIIAATPTRIGVETFTIDAPEVFGVAGVAGAAVVVGHGDPVSPSPVKPAESVEKHNSGAATSFFSRLTPASVPMTAMRQIAIKIEIVFILLFFFLLFHVFLG